MRDSRPNWTYTTCSYLLLFCQLSFLQILQGPAIKTQLYMFFKVKYFARQALYVYSIEEYQRMLLRLSYVVHFKSS